MEQNNFDSDNWENKLKLDFEGNKMGKIGSLVAKKVLARRKDFYFFHLWCAVVIILNAGQPVIGHFVMEIHLIIRTGSKIKLLEIENK